MFEELVNELLDNAFEERPDLYLVDLRVDQSNDIRVVIDGDTGVNLKDCIAISRAVEHNIDREVYDFSLEVTSAGAAAPLQLKRQYVKNIGRHIEVESQEGKKETGKLLSADDEQITLTWKAREPKPIGKGKVTVEKTWSPTYEEIKQAKVVIKFN